MTDCHQWPPNSFDVTVAVIAAITTPCALAAKTATTTIPIVFEVGGDPVELGLVASLNRPGGNLTGVGLLNAELGPKRLELLHELVPTAAIVAVIVNRANPNSEALLADLQSTAHSLGLELHVLRASSPSVPMMMRHWSPESLALRA